MAEQRDKKDSGNTAKSWVPGPQAIGAGIVLLLLAGYFLWMTIEMGTAAVSGAAPMFAFLGAAAIGCAAAGIALAIGRKR